ncbi:MAG: hypothetical protein H0W82_00020 [Actinobacteria bacterium]|nr:hypothetical protein [Actinomycetota bacterium]
MSATLLIDVATAIKAAIDYAAITYSGNALLVYDYEPRDLDSRPAVTVDGPTAITRREPDFGESQLGSDDWHLTYTLRIYTDLDDPEGAARQSRAILGQVIAAIDADETLGGIADLGAAFAHATREEVAEGDRQMWVYSGDLMVWALV